MRKDIDPPIYGDLDVPTAEICRQLNCQLVSVVNRITPNIDTCAVKGEEDNGRPDWIAIESHKSRIPTECPLYDIVNMKRRESDTPIKHQS